MIDTGCEVDLRRLEGVIGREVDGEEENTAGIWTVTLYRRCMSTVLSIVGYDAPNLKYDVARGRCAYGTHDRCLPMKLQLMLEYEHCTRHQDEARRRQILLPLRGRRSYQRRTYEIVTNRSS